MFPDGETDVMRMDEVPLMYDNFPVNVYTEGFALKELHIKIYFNILLR